MSDHPHGSAREKNEARAANLRGPRLVVSNDDTDAMLARATLDGDRQAFQTLVTRHLGRSVGIARRLLGGDADAEDVAQESFVRLWQRLGDLEIGAAGVGPWLRRVVFNLCMDRKRSVRPQDADALELLTSDADQERELEGKQLAHRVDVALQALPERQRGALVLFHFEGYSMKEIGETMEISAEAVESLLGRARRYLKNDLKDDWMRLLPEGHGHTGDTPSRATHRTED